MTKPRKNQELEETRRIMERLVKMPHKPHKTSKTKRPDKPKPARASLSKQNLNDRGNAK